MQKLFSTLCELQQDVVRNIVNLLPAKEAFADLIEQKNDAAIAEHVIATAMNLGVVESQEFHYTSAIEYPFKTDAFMSSRYSDGTFAVWYGALDLKTTIHETVHHMIKREMANLNFLKEEKIICERKVYDVFCQGILIDLRDKQKKHPALIAEDYSATQKIGKQLQNLGYPGLLAPSVRYVRGANVNVFKPEILSNPRVHCDLSYHLLPDKKKVLVYQKQQKIKEIKW